MSNVDCLVISALPYKSALCSPKFIALKGPLNLQYYG